MNRVYGERIEWLLEQLKAVPVTYPSASDEG